ncbi:hypothetical protein ZTR_11265 [Talaromyces verruculosus]|nr:hypothetical protein ZTR_11265 [Talaromyces verruculosus]
MVRTKPSDLPRPPRAQIGASNIPKPNFPTTRTIYYDNNKIKIEAGEAPYPTKTERRWVKVGYPSESQGGGLWVAEYDNPVFGAPWHGPGIPDGHVHLLLARDMHERCEILKQLGARFLERVEDYDGVGCLRAWEEK